jgi:hypothetical protein
MSGTTIYDHRTNIHRRNRSAAGGAGLPHFPESDLLLALRSVPAAGRWVIGQAFHSRPFLIQALLDKPTLKVRKIGLKQSSISHDVAIMCALAGDLIFDHRRHLK